ncbi:hypothetical protein Poli38472_001504 [Pythium oligandrum]|uniref:COX assembly mitochondrial protein n=1 Tax=Pythium oligandrum TaxID=41045 RepID=A0A8K1CUT4_PYTOL|nr:hypothetical protein Poli38472_001504 [Pythium oligandrum]|eukprot:TMW69348.1 hypothetical protein Poli38472_001504 [Pythium oligandrum]
MHPSLEREHPDCQDVIHALNTCHDENPMAKFFGACNDAKNELDKCFRAEKIRKRTENLERARASDAYVRQKMKEHRERRAQEQAAKA